ncbi:uncharacterized protein LOC123439455 [Hordeum vulgare subsp. vulgare]|uniref:uncharacterized protein LOC123439455 n=1 Tax=Hordeum vulgare subsp. vulgare TaxID=112509 RepID=UPI001D1A5281|nr:uncharacterized protein LOC123439455 [Hordeum vulgare subsp. vulgare]
MIMSRVKEDKKRKKRLQEVQAASTATLEGSRGQVHKGNFSAIKEVLENPIFPNELDTHPSEKNESLQHQRKERETISRKRKQGKMNNTKKKKVDAQNFINNDKSDKVGKPRDLGKYLPRRGILKYTKHTSMKLAKEKHVNSKYKEVTELYHNLVKRVKVSEGNGVICTKMPRHELSKQGSLGKLSLDAMASSSSSYGSIEEDKCMMTGRSTTNIPKEAFTKTEEANKHCDHEYSTKPSNEEMSAMIDLSIALPEWTGFDYRENWSQPLAADLENAMNSSSIGTCLHDEAIKVPHTNVVIPTLSLSELSKIDHGCSNVLVKETMNKRCFSTNMNHGGSKLNLQEGSPSTQQTMRFMGNDLVVCKTRGESFAKTTHKDEVNLTNTTQDSTFHFGYKTPNVGSQFVPVSNELPGDGLLYENRSYCWGRGKENCPQGGEIEDRCHDGEEEE